MSNRSVRKPVTLIGAALLLMAAALWLGLVEGVHAMIVTGDTAANLRAPYLLAYAMFSWFIPGSMFIALGILSWPLLRRIFGPSATTTAFATLVIAGMTATATWLNGAHPVLGCALVTGVTVAVWFLWHFFFWRFSSAFRTRVILAVTWVTLIVAYLGCARVISGRALSVPVISESTPWRSPPIAYARSRNAPAQKTGPQSVVVIVADTLRADALSSYGSSTATPNIDGIADDGWKVNDVISTSSWTVPSIASLWSSQTPRRHGVHSFTHVLQENVPLLSEHLQQSGFSSVGVFGNPVLTPKRGFGRGFDELTGYHHRIERMLFWVERINGLALQQGWLTPLTKGRKVILPTWNTDDGWTSRRSGFMSGREVTNAAIHAIDEHVDNDLFLYVHYFDPHDPYLPHPTGILSQQPPFDERNETELRRLYAGEVAHLDTQIGRLLDHLRQRQRYDDSLIVFTADHGEEFLDHGRWLHGHSLYDELVRIPLLVKFPGDVAPGPAPARASLIDVAPTVLAALNLPALPYAEGVDLTQTRERGHRFAERINAPFWLASLRGDQRHWIARLPEYLDLGPADWTRLAQNTTRTPEPVYRWPADPSSREVIETDSRVPADWSQRQSEGGGVLLTSEPVTMRHGGLMRPRITVSATAEATLETFLEGNQDGIWTELENTRQTVRATPTPRDVRFATRRVEVGSSYRLGFRISADQPTCRIHAVVFSQDDPREVFDIEVFDFENDPQQQNPLTPSSESMARSLTSLFAYLAMGTSPSQRPLSPQEQQRLRELGYVE